MLGLNKKIKKTPQAETKKINIEFIIGSLDVGGAEMHLAQLLPKLKDMGFNVRLTCLSSVNLALKPVFEKFGIVVQHPKPISKIFPNFIKKGLTLLKSLKILLISFYKDRVSIRHSFLPEAFVFTQFAAKLAFSNVPIIMSRRSMNHYQQRRPFIAKIERYLLKYPTLSLGNSKRITDQLLDEGLAFNKVGLIYNGINLKPYEVPYNKESIRKELAIDPEAIVITYLANLIPYKGHRDLIEALKLAQSQLPPKWHLYCIGADSGILKDLETLCKKYGLDKNISFVGKRNDAYLWLQASNIHVHSSHEEGFSNAILEAMAAGLPVIATDVGGNAEAVEDLKTGIIVSAKAPDQLAEAIISLASFPELCESYGKEGRKRAFAKFSIEHCANSYAALYNGLMS